MIFHGEREWFATRKGRAMTEQTAIDTATRRLTPALDALDAAVERELEADRGEARLTEQLHALGADRSKLAAELDARRRAPQARDRQPRCRRANRRRDREHPVWFSKSHRLK